MLQFFKKLKPEGNTAPLAKVIVVVGETGSGKSALGMRLAKAFDGEIICADSWTVYRGFDIGTAKPTKADQRAVPHHLLDIVDPGDGFSAAQFKRLAAQAILEVASRGKLPIIVGGTGLYTDSILFNYQFLPAGSKAQRDMLEKLSIPELLDKIASRGYSTDDIDIRNKRRLIRLLEAHGVRPQKQAIRPNTLVIGIGIASTALASSLVRRTAAMIDAGLENEVRQLVARYGWDTEPMKGIGYREFKDYLAGTESIEQVQNKIVGSSMQLAKKQRTWFKRNKYIQWVDDPIAGVALATTFLNT